MANPEEGSDDCEEQPIKSVVGADGLREFIMLPEWKINTSTLLGPITKFQITSPSFYPISQRNATMKG